MLPRTRGTVLSFGFSIAVLFSAVTASKAQPQPRSVWLRENMSESHRLDLTEKLRRITGWSNLAFAADGALETGNTQPHGGSLSARLLLEKAISGRQIIIVEDASNRSDVAFASVVPGRWLRKVAYQPEAYVVMIDFADFDNLIGDKPARDAFNAGWAALHELEHAVNDSADPAQLNEVGDCETSINVMRRELNLPERTAYFHTVLPLSGDSQNFPTTFVRLAFETRADTQQKKRYWLMWDAAIVGGSTTSATLAAVK